MVQNNLDGEFEIMSAVHYGIHIITGKMGVMKLLKTINFFS
jgi:hypothetical protein